MQTLFPYFFGTDLHTCSILHGQFPFGKTSGPTTKATKATGSDILLQLVYYEVSGKYINHANQVDHEMSGGSINYIGQLKPYGLDQVILNCNMALTKYLNLHWEIHFPAIWQSIAYSLQFLHFPRPNHSVHLSETKTSQIFQVFFMIQL